MALLTELGLYTLTDSSALLKIEAKKPSMDTSFHYKGFWWLPETPEHRVSGEVRGAQGEAATLELMGSLVPREGDALPERAETSELILGISATGKPITLWKCYLESYAVHGALNEPLAFTSRYLVSRTFVGTHFRDPTEITFNRVELRFSNLEGWIRGKHIGIKMQDRPDGCLAFEYQPLPAIEIAVGGYELSCYVSPSQSLSSSQITLSESAGIIVDSTERPLEDYLRVARRIQNLLSLAMTQPSFLVNVKAINQEQEQESPIAIYLWDTWRPRDVEVSPFNMLFTLPQIEDLKDLLERWFRSADLLEPVHTLFFSLLYNPEVYLEFQMIALAQALETYHRRKFGGKYQNDEDYTQGLYQALIAAIPQQLDDDFRQSLKDRLRYANEYSLRRRLKDLVRRWSDSIPLTFLSSEDAREKFIEQVVITRNYLVHHDQNLKEKAAHGGDLARLVREMEALLKVALLEELGFSTGRIAKMLPRDRSLSDLLSRPEHS